MIAAIPILLVKPVQAIHGRYSRRGFYILVAVTYCICMAAVFASCLYIDKPISMFEDLSRTRTTWQSYKDWYVVRDLCIGDTHYSGDPMKFNKDMYDWYVKHEHDDGVYLAHASMYQEATIQAYTNQDTTLKPFWYLAASPSYLKQLGVSVPNNLVEQAERGTRVYFFSESMNTKEMKDFLIASDRVSDSNIVTSFMKNPNYSFSSYDSSKELFTWSTDPALPTTSNDFVIALVTSNNMIPFESESLLTTGLDEYVKLNEQAASMLLNDGDRMTLDGSVSVRFATVNNYINGLQKNLSELFMLFAIVLLVLVATITIMIACLIGVINRVNAKEISVKYILGFGAWNIYRQELLLVIITTLIDICASIIFGSRAGIFVGLFLLVVGNLVVAIESRKRTAAIVLETVSEE